MSSPASPPPPKIRIRFLRWHRYVLGFCLAIFAAELGLFLLVFPWLSSWDVSWVPLHSRALSDIWMSRYFRGALSGLGLLNLYVAFAELAKQLKALLSRSNKRA